MDEMGLPSTYSQLEVDFDGKATRQAACRQRCSTNSMTTGAKSWYQTYYLHACILHSLHHDTHIKDQAYELQK